MSTRQSPSASIRNSWTGWHDRLQALVRRRPKLAALILLLLFVVIPPAFLSEYATRVLGLIGLYAMLALGLNIVVGFAGLLDLGYVAFYGIGSYTYALVASPQFDLHFNFWIALLIAVALAFLSGIIIGGPTLRLRGDYIAIVTLGFGEITYILMINLDRPVHITGGVNGILGIDPPTLLGHTIGADLALLGWTLSFTQQFYFLILAFVVFVLFFSYRLKDSRLGRAWIAIREDEDAAQAMGINTTRTKLLAYCLGASTAGITGAVSAAWSQSVYPDSFLFTESLNVLAMVIVGGMGSIPGAVLGAAALVGIPEVFREFQMFRMLAYALVLIGVMIYRPQGILGSERVRHEMMPEEAAEEQEAAASGAAGGAK